MDWKDDIGAYFAEKGIFRHEYLNKNLNSYINEWGYYLQEFEGVSVSSGYKTLDYGNRFHNCLKVSVRNKSIDPFYRFHAYIIYWTSQDYTRTCLFIKFTKRLAGFNVIRSISDEEDERNFLWAEEEFKEPEIAETEYVIQLLNNRMKKFYDKPNKMVEEESD